MNHETNNTTPSTAQAMASVAKSATRRPAASPTPLPAPVPNTYMVAQPSESVDTWPSGFVDDSSDEVHHGDGDQEQWSSVKTLWDDARSLRATAGLQFNALKVSRTEAKETRRKLAERLHHYKGLYGGGKGRDGKWRSFLVHIGMPRSTADRYVKDWERGQKHSKLLSEELLQTDEDVINKLVQKLGRDLSRRLHTQEMRAKFISKLQFHLDVTMERLGERRPDTSPDASAINAPLIN